jgi:hypothetical protein
MNNRRVRVALLFTGCAIAGLVITFTVGSLIGVFLTFGGVLGLAVTVLPAAIDSIARLLTTGLRR